MKILVWDVETAPNLAYVWGLWKQNISIGQMVDDGYMLCWAAKWLHSPEVMVGSLYYDGRENMLRRLHALLDEADVVVAHNGDSFDTKIVQAEFIDFGLDPTSKFKSVDTVKVTRQNFRFPSNKLDYLVQRFNLGKKLEHEGFDLWVKCMADLANSPGGKSKAWDKMIKYNIHDVKLEQRLYYKLRPWMKSHPNHGLFSDNGRPTCTNCGSIKVHKKGTGVALAGIYQRYKCSTCGTPLRGRFTLLTTEHRKNILTQEK